MWCQLELEEGVRILTLPFSAISPGRSSNFKFYCPKTTGEGGNAELKIYCDWPNYIAGLTSSYPSF